METKEAKKEVLSRMAGSNEAVSIMLEQCALKCIKVL